MLIETTSLQKQYTAPLQVLIQHMNVYNIPLPLPSSKIASHLHRRELLGTLVVPPRQKSHQSGPSVCHWTWAGGQVINLNNTCKNTVQRQDIEVKSA